MIMSCDFYTCCIFEPAQIQESISFSHTQSKIEIQKMWKTRYDKRGVKEGFCAYMCMYREAEKLIET